MSTEMAKMSLNKLTNGSSVFVWHSCMHCTHIMVSDHYLCEHSIFNINLNKRETQNVNFNSEVG